MECFFTVDLEDYKHSTTKDMGLRPVSDVCQTRRGVEQIVSTVAKVRGADSLTFFTTGQVAHDQPALVTELAAAGHEIACHTLEHDNVEDLGRERFEADLDAATTILEQSAGQPIVGFRAPNFAISNTLPWLYDVLVQRGFRYDSSLVAASGRAGQLPYDIVSADGGTLYEFPIYRRRIAGDWAIRVGGTYFRLLPVRFILRLLHEAAERGYTPVIYLHPADIDGRLEAIGLSEMEGLGWPARLKWILHQRLWTTSTESVVDKLTTVLGEFTHRGPLQAALPRQH